MLKFSPVLQSYQNQTHHHLVRLSRVITCAVKFWHLHCMRLDQEKLTVARILFVILSHTKVPSSTQTLHSPSP